MVDLLSTRSPPRRLPVNVMLGIVIVMATLGIVTMALPLRCVPGLFGDNACTLTARTPAHNAGAAPLAVAGDNDGAVDHDSWAVAKATVAAMRTPAPTPAAAKPPAPGLLAATFATLQATRSPVPLATAAVASEAVRAGSAAADVPTAPTVRRVSTIAISPDTNAGAPDAASPNVAPAVASAADPAPVPAPLPAARATEPAATKTAAADPPPASSTELRQVTGSGVTVRSGPSSSHGRLFALAGGQKVTLLAGGKKRGWVHITDTKGRSGWVYSSFLTKPKH